MSEISNHSLIQEFPDYRERITELKNNDEAFARKAHEYHDLDHRLRGLETRNVPTSDDHFTELKRRRMHLKDELHEIIVNGG